MPAYIRVSLNWVYVAECRVSTTGYEGFIIWCIINNIDVTSFKNWPFEHGFFSRLRTAYSIINTKNKNT